MRILLVEDDVEAADYIAQGLRDEGHELHITPDGRSGLFRAAGEDWDLLIIDRMLPGLEGLTLTRTLRMGGIATPVLFLTALGGIDDRVTGLNAGGDDYLVKPFALAELIARVAALGRRPQRTAQERRCCGLRTWRWICWPGRSGVLANSLSYNRGNTSCWNFS